MQCVLWLRQEKEEKTHKKKPSQTRWSLAQSSEQTVAFMWKDVSIAGVSSGIRSLRTFLRSAPNQLALDGLCEGGFQASGKANQNSQHVLGFMYF